jgi:malate synthase
MEARTAPVNIEIHAPICAAASEILTPDSLRFLGYLCHKFEDRRQALLAARASKALVFDSGGVPHYEGAAKAGDMGMREPHSKATEDPHWRCAAVPEDVMDRRVEITG